MMNFDSITLIKYNRHGLYDSARVRLLEQPLTAEGRVVVTRVWGDASGRCSLRSRDAFSAWHDADVLHMDERHGCPVACMYLGATNQCL